MTEGDNLAAESWASSALTRAFKVFEAAERGAVFRPHGGTSGTSCMEESYTFLDAGDDLAKSAAGLTTGYVHSWQPVTRAAGGDNDNGTPCPKSPTSTLEGQLVLDAASSEDDALIETYTSVFRRPPEYPVRIISAALLNTMLLMRAFR